MDRESSQWTVPLNDWSTLRTLMVEPWLDRCSWELSWQDRLYDLSSNECLSWHCQANSLLDTRIIKGLDNTWCSLDDTVKQTRSFTQQSSRIIKVVDVPWWHCQADSHWSSTNHQGTWYYLMFLDDTWWQLSRSLTERHHFDTAIIKELDPTWCSLMILDNNNTWWQLSRECHSLLIARSRLLSSTWLDRWVCHKTHTSLSQQSSVLCCEHGSSNPSFVFLTWICRLLYTSTTDIHTNVCVCLSRHDDPICQGNTHRHTHTQTHVEQQVAPMRWLLSEHTHQSTHTHTHTVCVWRCVYTCTCNPSFVAHTQSILDDTCTVSQMIWPVVCVPLSLQSLRSDCERSVEHSCFNNPSFVVVHSSTNTWLCL